MASDAAMKRVSNFFQFIRFSHTIFALPFALGSMLAAAGGLPSFAVFARILAAMVFARTAAMMFNRVVDWEIDIRNPRTAGRHLLLGRGGAIAGCAIASGGFLLSAWSLNNLCALLAPVALGIIFFYSLTKRFTHFAQFFLGLALSVAPVGAWLAVTGSFALPPLILAFAVLLWVAGFDLIYATQDYEVDMREGLKSMVVWLGIPHALRLAVFLHSAALAGFAAFGIAAGLGRIYYASLIVIGAALFYEHVEARRGSIASINRAFFQANAVAGTGFVVGVLLDHLALPH